MEFGQNCVCCDTPIQIRQRTCWSCHCIVKAEEQRLYKLARKRAIFNVWRRNHPAGETVIVQEDE